MNLGKHSCSKNLPLEIWSIILGEVSDCLTRSTSTTRSTNSMNVTLNSGGEIIINDQINALEIDTTRHELSRNQDPGFSRSKVLDNGISLQ